MLALKSDKSLIEKVLLFKKDDDDDLFEPAFATERLKLFINVTLVVELLHLLLKLFHSGFSSFRQLTLYPVQKLIVIINKFPRTFDSILSSYVIDAY